MAQRNKIEVVGDDPVWSLPPDHPHVRYAIKIKEYPNNVQKKLMLPDLDLLKHLYS